MATRTEHSRRSRDGAAEEIPRAALVLARHWREVVLVVTCAAAAFALRVFNADVAAWLFVLVVAASVAGIVVLRERLADGQREVEALGRRDALTGIGNSRALRERLAYEVTRHGRHNRLLSVLLLDLDDFDRINERLGHPVGDQVLRAVADSLTAAVRGEDTVVRLAGDQFAVIAPDVDGDERTAARPPHRPCAGERRRGRRVPHRLDRLGRLPRRRDRRRGAARVRQGGRARRQARAPRAAGDPGAQVFQLRRPRSERELP